MMRKNDTFCQIKSQVDLLSFGEERVTVSSTWDRTMTLQVSVENPDRTVVPNSFPRVRLYYSQLWLHLKIALSFFDHDSHAKPPLRYIANIKLASLLVPRCAPVAHNDSGGQAKANKTISS